jgi:hypothetical protein
LFYNLFMENMPKPENTKYEGLTHEEQLKIDEIKNMLIQINEADFSEHEDLMKSFREIRKNFPNSAELYNYKIWNAAIGGSIFPEKMPFMDLPGNIIENLIKEKYERIIGK